MGKPFEVRSEEIAHQTSASPSRARKIPYDPSPDARTTHLLHAPIRIKTRNLDLKSGFEYTRILFDLGIDPTRWDEFSRDVYKASKLNGRDEAAVISTIIGFSLIGLAGVGVVYGEKVRESRELKRIITNRSEGGVLAQVLDSWNEGYFHEFGVKVWVEVNEAALREEARKKKEEPPDFVRPKREFKEKTPLVAFSNKKWKRRIEEKKYMVVMSPLNGGEGLGSAARPPAADLVDMSNEPLLRAADKNPFVDPPEIRRG
jgi:hypothetical protein